MRIGRLSSLPFFVGFVAVAVVEIVVASSSQDANIITIVLCAFLPVLIFLIVARLHDANYSGWWWPLVLFTSLLGVIAVAAISGTRGPNRYGAQPAGKLKDLFSVIRSAREAADSGRAGEPTH